MKWCWIFQPVALLLLVNLTASAGLAQGGKVDPAEEAAIMKNAEAFVEAFQKGDAAALAAFWTPEGDFTDQTGTTRKGREAITKAFKQLFADHKDLKLRIDITGLRFVTPDVAIEDGTTTVLAPDGGPPSRARYTNVHVKKDGKWLLDSVREAPFAPPGNHEHLRGLEFLVGDWTEPSDNGESARVSFSWSETQNFLISTFATTQKEIPVSGGTQWIGWDPVAKQIRSWSFEADGGFGAGFWTRDGDKVTIKTSAVLADGKKLTGVATLTKMDANSFSWQLKERTLDGKPLPETPVVKFKRVK
ncbi:hypothetical protein BH10PLA2_BH10PLA2_20160 [soil metagenome]